MSDAATPASGQIFASDQTSASDRLNTLLAGSFLPPLTEEQLQRFLSFLSLIIRWNTRVNLTAIRSEEGILSRHFVESIACAHALPAGITNLLDFGSGAGLPGIPISICRPEISVTLAESQGKKAAFLQEAVRTLGLSANVYAGRAEGLQSVFDCVTLRAVDHMPKAVAAASKLVAPDGLLALLTTESEFPALRQAAGPLFSWLDPASTPGGADRILALGRQNQTAP